MIEDDDCMHCEISKIVFTRFTAGMPLLHATRDVAQVLADVLASFETDKTQDEVFQSAMKFIKEIIEERRTAAAQMPEPPTPQEPEEERRLH